MPRASGGQVRSGLRECRGVQGPIPADPGSRPASQTLVSPRYQAPTQGSYTIL